MSRERRTHFVQSSGRKYFSILNSLRRFKADGHFKMCILRPVPRDLLTAFTNGRNSGGQEGGAFFFLFPRLGAVAEKPLKPSNAPVCYDCSMPGLVRAVPTPAIVADGLSGRGSTWLWGVRRGFSWAARSHKEEKSQCHHRGFDTAGPSQDLPRYPDASCFRHAPHT